MREPTELEYMLLNFLSRHEHVVVNALEVNMRELIEAAQIPNESLAAAFRESADRYRKALEALDVLAKEAERQL